MRYGNEIDFFINHLFNYESRSSGRLFYLCIHCPQYPCYDSVKGDDDVFFVEQMAYSCFVET